MAVSSISIIAGRAQYQTPIAVFDATKLNQGIKDSRGKDVKYKLGDLNAVFASTYTTQKMIRENHSAYLITIDRKMSLRKVIEMLEDAHSRLIFGLQKRGKS